MSIASVRIWRRVHGPRVDSSAAVLSSLSVPDNHQRKKVSNKNNSKIIKTAEDRWERWY